MKPPSTPLNEAEASGRRKFGSWLSFVFVSMLAVAVCAALAVLTLGIMPQVIVLGAAILSFAGVNYLIWGWWLPKFLPKDEESDEAP